MSLGFRWTCPTHKPAVVTTRPVKLRFAGMEIGTSVAISRTDDPHSTGHSRGDRCPWVSAVLLISMTTAQVLLIRHRLMVPADGDQTGTRLRPDGGWAVARRRLDASEAPLAESANPAMASVLVPGVAVTEPITIGDWDVYELPVWLALIP